MTKIHNFGRIYGEKIKYEDGIGCCVWFPFPGTPPEDGGLAFDFSDEDIDDMIGLLQILKDAEPDEPPQSESIPDE